MKLQDDVLSVIDIVTAVEAGKIVRIPFESIDALNNARNNILSRIYKQRSQLRAVLDVDFQSVSTVTETAEDYSHHVLVIKMQDRPRTAFRCCIIEPAAAESSSHG